MADSRNDWIKQLLEMEARFAFNFIKRLLEAYNVQKRSCLHLVLQQDEIENHIQLIRLLKGREAVDDYYFKDSDGKKDYHDTGGQYIREVKRLHLNNLFVLLAPLHPQITKLEHLSNKLYRRAFPDPKILHLDDLKKEKGRKFLRPFQTPPGTEWENIQIYFISEEEVVVTIKRKKFPPLTFRDMGFQDSRGDQYPDKLWALLLLFATHTGELTWSVLKVSSLDTRVHMKKRISCLRQALKDYFGIKEDPFYPYQEVKAYKARFKIDLRSDIFESDRRNKENEDAIF